VNAIFEVLFEMFSYTFLVRAVIVGLLVSLCAALLGVSLVLKRYSMIGDGLSHVGFGSLAVATAMNAAPLAVSIPIVVLAAFLLLRISENSKIKGDAAIALISTASLAVGVVVISMTTGMNTDVCNYLFGSILAMNNNDVTLSVILAIVVLAMFMLFYNKIFAVTFDENFAKATGVKTGVYNMLIAFLTAITIVLGMRMMGALLITSLIIFPSLTSMRVCKKFKSVTLTSAVISVVCFFIGVVISYVYATPTGASVVIINIIAFGLFWLVGTIKDKKGSFLGMGNKLKKRCVGYGDFGTLLCAFNKLCRTTER
jgi:zinc transport system permease protein